MNLILVVDRICIDVGLLFDIQTGLLNFDIGHIFETLLDFLVGSLN